MFLRLFWYKHGGWVSGWDGERVVEALYSSVGTKQRNNIDKVEKGKH